MQTPFESAIQQPSPITLLPEQANALTQLANAVLHDNVHLAITAQDGPTAEHAGQALQAWWQAMAPQVAISHFQSQPALTWIGHINQLVSSQGLELAMQAPATRTTPLEIGILHGADQLTPADLKMLKDLAAHLPGLPIRWVLLFKTTPTAGAAGAAGANGAAVAAGAAGNWPHHLPEPQNSDCAHWLTWHMNQQASPKRPQHVLLHTESLPEAIARPLVKPQKWSDHAAILGLGALFSLGLLAWILRSESMPSTDVVTQAQPESQLSTQTTHALDTQPQAALSGQAVSTVPSSTASSDAVPASAQDSGPKPATENTDNQAMIAPIVPDAARRGVRWLAQIPPDHFVLEHGRFQNPALALNVVRGREELKNARIIMVQTTSPQEPSFLLITGPFRSLDRAKNYKTRENLPAQIPIVQVSRVLQKSLPRPAP